ncbi:MAG: translation initiation factor IF-2 N-terminal domain-containing protein, partial [Planctomycetes bacterium]|nr:translation initiation factor IF-2 N-terminal domain-containing protein [Planctomycetota bacterium]
MAEKMRVHILAKQLKVSSKAILTKCSAEGLPVKNHMTALSAGLEATI